MALIGLVGSCPLLNRLYIFSGTQGSQESFDFFYSPTGKKVLIAIHNTITKLSPLALDHAAHHLFGGYPHCWGANGTTGFSAELKHLHLNGLFPVFHQWGQPHMCLYVSSSNAESIQLAYFVPKIECPLSLRTDSSRFQSSTAFFCGVVICYSCWQFFLSISCLNLGSTSENSYRATSSSKRACLAPGHPVRFHYRVGIQTWVFQILGWYSSLYHTGSLDHGGLWRKHKLLWPGDSLSQSRVAVSIK